MDSLTFFSKRVIGRSSCAFESDHPVRAGDMECKGCLSRIAEGVKERDAWIMRRSNIVVGTGW